MWIKCCAISWHKIFPSVADTKTIGDDRNFDINLSSLSTWVLEGASSYRHAMTFYHVASTTWPVDLADQSKPIRPIKSRSEAKHPWSSGMRILIRQVSEALLRLLAVNG